MRQARLQSWKTLVFSTLRLHWVSHTGQSGYPGGGDSKAILPSPQEMAMMCRGVRGATTVESNSRQNILVATRQLLALMIRQNGIEKNDVGSVILTTTTDLNAEFPALAARQLGWHDVALMCFHELNVPGSLPLCIRVLLHWNTEKAADEIVHVYIKGAKKLRPDRIDLPPVDWDELEAWIESQLPEDQQTG